VPHLGRAEPRLAGDLICVGFPQVSCRAIAMKRKRYMAEQIATIPKQAELEIDISDQIQRLRRFGGDILPMNRNITVG
jgi:hypothetical protein